MVASSTMDPESVGLVRDYANELLGCVVFFFFCCYCCTHLTAPTDTW